MATVCNAQPSALLREYVRGYHYREIHLQDGPVIRPVSAEADPMLVFALRDAYSAYEYATGRSRVLPAALLVGPQARRVADLEIEGHHSAFSISFQPGGVYRLFGVRGRDVVDYADDAVEILDPAIATLLAALRSEVEPVEMVRRVEAFLLQRLGSARKGLPVHQAALALRSSHGLADLPSLVDSTGHSVRQFDRSFLTQFGMTPKRYARINRFGFALGLKLRRPRLTWTEISYEAGYFDQNHLVKDFRLLVGAAPGAYFKAVAAPPEPLRPGPYPS